MATSIPFRVNQVVQATSARIDQKETKPPPAYTDATLIDDMEHIHRYVEDPRRKEVLKETKGLGTPRTRDDAIEKNVQDGYFIRKGKTLEASDLAIEVLSKVAPSLKDPGTTALWEAALQNVERGKTSAEKFMQQIEQSVVTLIQQADQTTFDGKNVAERRAEQTVVREPVEPLPGEGAACPKCSEGKLVTRVSSKTKNRFLSCSCYPKCKHIAS